MLYNKRLSALLVCVAFFATSCMDMSTSGSGSVDLTPLVDQQALFEKKIKSNC